ncbi:MAG: hypothetical protein M1464_00270 [Candidatus Thermoplasmatota archaeon]|jgi:hypothetical protein|nr:hypothetical protein [Candidatus Thermoplasmatota archaeon]MCL5881358.1 hypothetical protein [Candidatus Thermoplasmatota archaeon]
MNGNVKGWIGFLVLVIIVIGGAFGTSHILPSKASALSVTSISSNVKGDFIASNSTYYVNLSNPVSSLSFNISVKAPVATGVVNATIIPPVLLNITQFNSTYNSTYAALIKQGESPSNATANATTFAYQDSTYVLFNNTYVNTSLKAGTATVSFTATLNSTALSLMKKGEPVIVSFTAASGQYGVVGSIVVTKDY